MSKFSVTAFGFPGKLIIKVLLSTPQTALEKQANGVILHDSVVTYTIIELQSFSITDFVASGVISLGQSPVPPDVKIKLTFSFSASCLRALTIISNSSGTMD